MQRLKQSIYLHRVDIAITVGIFVIAALPRLLDLGIFLTADEKNWLVRSYEFVRAFKDFRFNDMLQTTHPGVTTLWLSGFALTVKMYLSHTVFTTAHLATFIKAAQFSMALANTLAVPVMYVFLLRLFKQRSIPLVASFIIALDPLLIGYARVVHVDALLTSLLFLAVLATLLYVQNGYSRRWLIVSAVVSALAILTKIPAVFMLPFLILVLLAQGKKDVFARQYITQRARDLIIWGLTVVLLGIVIWPAIMWVPNPAGNALTVKRDLVVAVGTPHNMTEEYTLNPWHYPAALLARTTPPTLIFGIAGLLIILVTSIRNRPLDNKQTWWLLIAYIFFFIVMMTLGAKKGDRYILPVWPAIDTLAALGIVMMAQKITPYFMTLRRFEWLTMPWGMIGNDKKWWENYVTFLLSFFILCFLGITLLSYHPYAIAYSNPLFPDNLSQELGWGEGLEQVAAWLNNNHPNAVVASWYPEELGAFTSARVAHINAHEQTNVEYIVLYRNMFGRAPDHPANNFIDEYYKKRLPVFVVYVHGQEFAWVYAKHAYDRVIGELLPGQTVTQTVTVGYPNLIGFEIWFATYSGKATSGTVRVTTALGTWTVPVKDILDTKPQVFTFSPVPSPTPRFININIRAEGTSAGNAPSVRFTKNFVWRENDMVLNGTTKPGNVAVRLRYAVGDQVATEDDTLLLQEMFKGQ